MYEPQQLDRPFHSLFLSLYQTHLFYAARNLIHSIPLHTSMMFGLTKSQVVSAGVALQYVFVSCIMTFFNKVRIAVSHFLKDHASSPCYFDLPNLDRKY